MVLSTFTVRVCAPLLLEPDELLELDEDDFELEHAPSTTVATTTGMISDVRLTTQFPPTKVGHCRPAEGGEVAAPYATVNERCMPAA